MCYPFQVSYFGNSAQGVFPSPIANWTPFPELGCNIRPLSGEKKIVKNSWNGKVFIHTLHHSCSQEWFPLVAHSGNISHHQSSLLRHDQFHNAHPWFEGFQLFKSLCQVTGISVPTLLKFCAKFVFQLHIKSVMLLLARLKGWVKMDQAFQLYFGKLTRMNSRWNKLYFTLNISQQKCMVVSFSQRSKKLTERKMISWMACRSANPTEGPENFCELTWKKNAGKEMQWQTQDTFNTRKNLNAKAKLFAHRPKFSK